MNPESDSHAQRSAVKKRPETVDQPAPLERAMLEQAAVDPGAFALLYDRYYSRIYNYIRYRCEDSDTADDLTSQVFERLLKKIKQYSPARGLFEPWLFAIVRNIVTDHHRSPRKREVPWDDLQQNPTADPSPESQVIRLENMTELLRALERLDERSRDLLGLKFAAGLTNRQIAELTKISESNVGVTLYRAVARLRRQLQESHAGVSTGRRQ